MSASTIDSVRQAEEELNDYCAGLQEGARHNPEHFKALLRKLVAAQDSCGEFRDTGESGWCENCGRRWSEHDF